MLPLLVALAVLAALAGCSLGAPQSCTEVGCISGVGVTAAAGGELPADPVLEVCVAQDCRRSDPAGAQTSGLGVELDGPPPDDETVRVRLLTTDGEVALETELTGAGFVRQRPNGPDCPPLCYRLDLVFDAGALTPAA